MMRFANRIRVILTHLSAYKKEDGSSRNSYSKSNQSKQYIPWKDCGRLIQRHVSRVGKQTCMWGTYPLASWNYAREEQAKTVQNQNTVHAYGSKQAISAYSLLGVVYFRERPPSGRRKKETGGIF
ncbi:hypothetical protein STEG23_033177 [Scotinomys teguina]